MTPEEKRKGLKRFYKAIEAYERAWAIGLRHLSRPRYPEELRGMTCGAKNRRGALCKNTNIEANGRCKFHGGYSTGPITPKGKRRSAKNLPIKQKPS